jgi:hypothetical protein
MITYTVIGRRFGRVVRVKRTCLLSAEFTAELMEDTGWTVTEIRMGRSA